MTWAKGYYDSMHGRIESSWEIKGDTVIYEFRVPANTSATLYLVASSPDDVTESGQPVSKAQGVESLGYEDGRARYRLASGSYQFATPRLHISQ